jgi:trimeric autotransporter adhesin
MKRKLFLSLLTLGVLAGASLNYTRSAASSSPNERAAVTRAAAATAGLMPLLTPTTLDVDRTDDNAAATACTPAANDCSLRGAIIAANADPSANPVIINLQPATTYNLTLTNSTQENAAATGDLDITTTAHTVTIAGGGSSGPNATVIDAAGLNTGNFRDRAFHVTGTGVTVVFQDLVIRNGKAADDGTSGTSTNPANQTTHRAGGGILNSGGAVTLSNVRIQSCEALGRGDSNANPAGILEARGGGLASLGLTGNVVITGSRLSNNVAQGGDGPAGVNNNQASNAKGGAVYFEGGTLDIEGSQILNSSADGGNGGAVDQNGQTNGGFGGAAQGGGVWIGAGTATINNTTLENTAADGGNSGAGGNGAEPAGEADGGGVYSLGNLTVSNSTLHLTSAHGGNGGNAFGNACFGAHNAGDGGAARGGAVYADGGSLTVDTDTFANNSAVGGNGGNGGQIGGGCGSHGSGGAASGGAIANNSATVNVKHATVSLNNAQGGNSGVNEGGANKPPRLVAEGTGGGLRPSFGAVTLENTIVAGNTAANGAGDTTGAPTPGPDVDGTVTSSGHNLLGNTTDANGFGGVGDLTGVNPLLAALADNTGPTQTMALTPGSPAIDAGVASGAAFDQRGLPRTFDDPGTTNAATSDGTDIGAFELQPLCSLSCPGDVSVPNDTDACGAFVNYATPSDSACGTITCDHPAGSFFPVGDTTVTCTSTAGPSCSFKVTVNDAQNPTVNAPPDVNLNTGPASNSCGLLIDDATLGTATASDNCSASITRTGVPAGNVFPVGTTSVVYTATDPASHTAQATQTVTVTDNTLPVVTPPANVSVSADPGTCSVSLDPGTATATDNCPGVSVAGTRSDHLALNAPYPVGTTTITWTATDAHTNTAAATQTVTVNDSQPPVITNLSASPASLWPPDHTMQDVTVSYDAADNCGAVNCVIASVASNEPVNGTGDGDTAPDWLIVDPHHVELRAERAGTGAGRVYTITVACTDGSNNTTTKTVTVFVPKSQK